MPSPLQLPPLHPGPCSVWGLYARPSAPRSGSDALAGFQIKRQCNGELSRRGPQGDAAALFRWEPVRLSGPQPEPPAAPKPWHWPRVPSPPCLPALRKAPGPFPHLAASLNSTAPQLPSFSRPHACQAHSALQPAHSGSLLSLPSQEANAHGRLSPRSSAIPRRGGAWRL